MRRYRHRLAFLLVMAFIAVECYAAKPKVIDAPSARMTVSEARMALTASLSHLETIKSVSEVKVKRHKVTFVGTTGPDTAAPGTTKQWFMIFAGAENLSLESFRRAHYVHSQKDLGNFTTVFDNKTAAMMFVDALLTLKAAALAPDTEEEANFATFTANAQTWMQSTTKPEMTDDARTYRLVAEDAFKRKDFAAALEAYCKALAAHPMWPAGHYNAALLAAETEDYESAAHHMRRYLVLAPDAQDAESAKDKLLLWQHKAKE